MKHLIIIGAGGAGRECYDTSLRTKEYENKEYDIKGFLDINKNALNGYDGYPPVIGDAETYKIEKDDIFICAFGNPKLREHYSKIIFDKGGEFINIIDKEASIGKNTEIGIGCIIKKFVLLSCNVSIGNFVYIQPFSDIGHDVKIGNYCHINTYAFMGGASELKDCAILQTRATLLPGKVVYEGGCVGAGSVAIRNVKCNTTVMGVPAMKVVF